MLNDDINEQATCANIMRIMKEKGITAAQLQEKIGFTAVQGIYKWKAVAEGRPKYKGIPSTAALFHIADALGVSVHDIVVLND